MNDYTQTVYVNSSTDGMIVIPSALPGFFNTYTETAMTESDNCAYCIHGDVPLTAEDRVCPECGGKMHVHNTYPDTVIWHLPFGSSYSCLKFDKKRLRCTKCGLTKMQTISFQAEGHHITQPLYRYTIELLARGTYTLKEVGWLTGLNKNVVKAIDLKRLEDKYTVDGATLIRPEQRARFLGIDEFKLHDGYRYATHIIDMEPGIYSGSRMERRSRLCMTSLTT